MSNTNFPVTKLRSNETTNNRGPNQTDPNSDPGLQVDYVASGSLHNSNVRIT